MRSEEAIRARIREVQATADALDELPCVTVGQALDLSAAHTIVSALQWVLEETDE